MSYRRWLYLATFLFGVGFVWGLAAPVGSTRIIAEDIAGLEELAGLLSSLPQVAIFIIIFIKNLSVVAISLLFSPLLCLAPVLILFVNGMVLGVVSVLVTQQNSPGLLLAGLIPHGIFELPAFIMAEAVALSFGTAAILAVFSREKRKLLTPNIKQHSKRLVIVVVLLLVAAAVETYITPLLFEYGIAQSW